MQVVQAPDSRLRIQTKPVKKITPGLLTITKDMIKLAKTYKDPEGVGLAATQIGRDERFFVAKSSDKKTRNQKPSTSNQFISVFNPKILWLSKKTKTYLEGCLSIPNYYGEVKRSLSIKVSYQNDQDKLVNKKLNGILAWIFQHEINHLDGILFPDMVLQQKGKFYKVVGKDKTGTDIFEEITI